MDAQRALLDELMGAARNLTDEERRGFKEIKWDDRESFENSPRHDSYVPKFDAELVQFCEKLVNDLDRKVRRGRERLAQEVEPPPPPTLSSEKSEQLSVLEEKIKNLLEQVEALGEEGKVDEAEALMRKVEALNTEKAMLLQRPNEKALAMVHEKKMALCEVCGSFLVSSDAVDRAQSHVTGKQHVGYGMVRDFLAEQKAAKDKGKEEERLVRGKETDDKRKPRESESRRSGSRERERHRDRGRDHRKPYDRRSRSGREGRERSRSRSPHGRSGGHRRVSRSPVRQY